MQGAYISRLLELAEQDDRICHILADSGTNFDEHFKRNFPGRMFNFGIAEQNAIGVSAGMALAGKLPFVFLQGAFIVYRALEFVRDDICFQNLNVKLIGQGSGLVLSSLGPSHHTSEDIAILRALPHLRIFSPATPIQTYACTGELYQTAAPCYMRIGMSNEKEFFSEDYKLPDTGQDIFGSEESDILIFCTGSILEEVMEAVSGLRSEGKKITVINVVRIKPFDESNLLTYVRKAKKIFTIEEHQVQGGLGSIVSDTLSKHGIGVPVARKGLENTFAKGYSPDLKQIRCENGLDSESIMRWIEHETV